MCCLVVATSLLKHDINAQADIIFGDVNPSGKLPYTVGRSLKDYGEAGQIMYIPNGLVPQQNLDGGLYIDYRHFDKVWSLNFLALDTGADILIFSISSSLDMNLGLGCLIRRSLFQTLMSRF